ncbi:MAG: hypothetical protein OEZ30_00270 [Candidatus Aminicenantes bacterium]|nr:hypothetical protein [Candidatus Aminicenantes bacterium]
MQRNSPHTGKGAVLITYAFWYFYAEIFGHKYNLSMRGIATAKTSYLIPYLKIIHPLARFHHFPGTTVA